MRGVLRRVISLVRRSRRLRCILDEAYYKDLMQGNLWIIDDIFTMCRRRLFQDIEWRYGPLRIRDVAKEAFEGITLFTSLRHTCYCDLGCGSHHPFGTSAIMYINGASSTIALDIARSDIQRASEALYDLLIECMINPSLWHWSGIGAEEYLTRIRQFDLVALRNGNLQAGLLHVPMRYIITDIRKPALVDGKIDIMSSRAVLEHFLDFEVSIRQLYRLMSPGGFAYHHIDLTDHRAHHNPSQYHYWSFLTEGEDWSDSLVNRLRVSEIRYYFEKTGFEIVNLGAKREVMPTGIHPQLKGRFAEMPKDELDVTVALFTLHKPID